MENNDKQLMVTGDEEAFSATNMSIREISFIANEMAAAKMFTDLDNAHKAFVKIMAGASMGVGPFEAVSGIHIIQGKAVMGAGLMASRVKGSGKYNYRVKEQTDKACRIEFLERNGDKWDNIGVSEFTIEDARKAGTKNTDKYPKNMLFARAMSNGVKWYCPDVFGNTVVYTEGEIIEGEAVHSNASTPKKETKEAPVSQPDEPEVEIVEPELNGDRPAGVKKMRRIMAMLDEKGFKTDPEKKAVFNGLTGLESSKDLTHERAEELIRELSEADPEALKLFFTEQEANA